MVFTFYCRNKINKTITDCDMCVKTNNINNKLLNSYLLLMKHYSQCFNCIIDISFNPYNYPSDRCSYCLHFTSEEAEAEKNQAACPRLYDYYVAELGFEFR